MLQTETGETQLFSVYVPTNHIYVGDIFLLSKADIIHTNLSVREGLGKLHMSSLLPFLIFVAALLVANCLPSPTFPYQVQIVVEIVVKGPVQHCIVGVHFCVHWRIMRNYLS